MAVARMPNASGFVLGVHAERTAPAIARHLAVADHQLAVLEHQRGRPEHICPVARRRIHRHVRDRARAEMSAVLQSEKLCGRGPRHHGDLDERIFARDRGERRDLQRLRRQLRHPFGAQIAVHQQRKNFRIGRERRAIGMIGGEEHACRIRDEQKQFEAHGPLNCVVKISGPIVVRHDSAAVRIGLENHPFSWACLGAGIELAQHIGRDRHRLSEHDLADVDGQVLGSIDRLRDLRGGGRKSARSLAPVAIELQVGQMQRQAFGRLDGGERGFDIPRQAEIVAMQVQRMRHADLVDRALQRLDDLARGDAVERHDVVEREFPRIGLECRRAARIDDLDAERAGSRKRPGHVICEHRRRLVPAQQIEQEIVVAEHRQNRLVDDGNVRELQMRVKRRVGRDRRLDHTGEPHCRIAAPGLERGGGNIRERARRGVGR